MAQVNFILLATRLLDARYFRSGFAAPVFLCKYKECDVDTLLSIPLYKQREIKGALLFNTLRHPPAREFTLNTANICCIKRGQGERVKESSRAFHGGFRLDIENLSAQLRERY